MKIISVTDIEGFKLGNAENSEKGTGCTVIICEEGAVGGVDVRGGGPATRETDLLKSENTVNAVNAVVLSGGSAFGLEASSGVMRELADIGVGFDAGDNIIVPIVCGASLYDLPVGDTKAFPDIYMGIQAVRNAYAGQFAKGNHGAGTGATVGKMKGYDRAMKTGLGTFACGDGVVEVGAIAAVNAVGDIYNGAGKIIAGLRSEDGKSIYGTIKTLKSMVHDRAGQTDESTSFINRYDIEQALAAAAKQYKEEETAAEAAVKAEESVEAIEEPAVSEVPAEEIPAETEETTIEESAEEITEEIIEEPAEEIADESCEVTHEETSEETVEETAEEIAEEAAVETVFEPVEIIVEEAEESQEEIAEEAAGEPEEFIPETPPANFNEESNRGYDEISIPAAAPEPVITEEPEPEEVQEEVVEPAEGIAEEAAEEPAEEIAEDTAEEIAEETAAESVDESVEAVEEPCEETAEAVIEEQAEEEAPAEEFVPEDAAAVITEEAAAEVIEKIVEEEPVVLTREDMGYDIVFNTTISCLITNAALTKSQANKLASILHDAYARAIKPVHGTLDGDTVFVLATGKQKVNFDAFAALATDVMQYAIIDGATSAEGAYGLPAARDM